MAEVWRRFDGGIYSSRAKFFPRSNKASNFTCLITFICKYIVNYYKFSFAPTGVKLTISIESFEMTSCGPCDLCIQDSGETKIEQLSTVLYFLLIDCQIHFDIILKSCSFTIIITLLCYQSLYCVSSIASLDSFFGIDLAWQFNIILSYSHHIHSSSFHSYRFLFWIWIWKYQRISWHQH